MKAFIFKIAFIILFVSSKAIAAVKTERIVPIYFNEPNKRIYILGALTDKNDHQFFSRYLKEGAKSVFLNFSGGFGGEIITPLVIKYKLPVFVGRFCFSACAIISLSAPKLYTSKKTLFLIHDSGTQPGYTQNDAKYAREYLNKVLLNAGATDLLMDTIKKEREKDKSKFKNEWAIRFDCKKAKKFFNKNEIICDSFSKEEGKNFIMQNHPYIKKIYCRNEKKKQVVETIFNPGCPNEFERIEKIKFRELEKIYLLIDEQQPGLRYNFDNGKLDLLINELKQVSTAGLDLNFNEIAKKHGFKSFKDAVKEYKKRFDYKISVADAKDYFEGVDPSIKIDYSQRNLDLLYKNLKNNKILNNRSKYFKTKTKNKAVSACIDLRKVLAKLTINPESKSPKAFVFGTMYLAQSRKGAIDGALSDNQLWRVKLKLPPCDYIVFDVNDENNLSVEYVQEYLKRKDFFESRKKIN